MSARQTFANLVERDDPAPSLAEAALCVAAEEYPELEVGLYLAKLDWLAERARRLGEKLGLQGAALLRVALAEEQGFHGNGEDRADPRNSFLNEVLDRRTGIPITLSIVYIEVARRLGLAAEGIAFPGHFLVKIGEGAAASIVDPFHGGRVLARGDCELLLDRSSGGRLQFSDSLLAPASWRNIIYRLLANLKQTYSQHPRHYAQAIGVIDRMLLVYPRVVDDVRDRGILHYQLRQMRGGQALVPIR